MQGDIENELNITLIVGFILFGDYEFFIGALDLSFGYTKQDNKE